MREILFRGKRVDNGEWAYSRCPDGVLHSGTIREDFIPETVGQFTGLTDKNGTRIFEGDICKAKNQVCESIIVVKYGTFRPEFFYDCAKNCGYNIKNRLFGLYAESIDGEELMFPDTARYGEVIGNVHDNPELIRGAENG